MPPVLLSWRPETICNDSDSLKRVVLNQSEPVSVASRTAISVPSVILISSLPPVHALPTLPTLPAPLPASWPAPAPPSPPLSAPLPPPSPLIVPLIPVVVLIIPAHRWRGWGAIATTPWLTETKCRFRKVFWIQCTWMSLLFWKANLLSMIVTLVGGPSDPSSCRAASSGEIFDEMSKRSFVGF